MGCKRRTWLRSRFLIVSQILLLLVTACGPCGSLRRSFDERWRHELQHLALGERVDAQRMDHAKLRIGPEALRLISSLALRETEVFSRTMTLRVPEEVWGRSGNIQLDMEIRADQVSSAGRLDYYGDYDVELRLSVLVQARFEIPGHRSRWTWNARSAVRVPVGLDDARPHDVVLSFEDAELIAVDGLFPWEISEVPEAVGDIVYNGLASSIEAMLMENQNASFRLLSLGELNVPRVSLPVRVSSLHFEEESGVMEVGFLTALRPVRREAALEPSTTRIFGDDEVSLLVPVETLDAAMRQQSLRGATPTVVALDDASDRRWNALWTASELNDGVWAGAWELWCLESAPCKKRHLNTEVRGWAQEGQLIVARDPVPPAFGEEGKTATADVVALAELQRATLADFNTGVIQWLLQLRPDMGLYTEIRAVEMSGDALETIFVLR